MKYRVIFLILGFLLPSFSNAQVDSFLCSPKGYTVFIINGMYTDDEKARENRKELAKHIPETYKNEPVVVGYLHNPSYFAGVGDMADVAAQKITENMLISDYDLVEIITDASRKVMTQKLLLVGHSQGNFYANSFYNEITGFGKIPGQSIGVYGVASPASYVAGLSKKYLTSSTDEVINKIRWGGILDVLPSNTDVVLSPKDPPGGHSFSKVYLEYEGDRIAKDIQFSLDWLSSTSIQDKNKPCIPPPEVSAIHEIQSVALAFIDNPREITETAVSNFAKTTYNLAHAFGSGVLGAASNLASAIGNIGNKFGASAISATDGSEGGQALGDALSTGPIIAVDEPAPEKSESDTINPTDSPETEQTTENVFQEPEPPKEDSQATEITVDETVAPTTEKEIVEEIGGEPASETPAAS